MKMLSKTSSLAVAVIIIGLASAVLVGVSSGPEVNISGISVGYDIAVSIDHAFVSNNDGFVVIDISSPRSPKHVIDVQVTGGAHGLAMSGDLLYTGGDHGLYVFNISDPSSPSLLHTHSSFSGVYQLFISGDLAHLLTCDGRLQILEIENSSDPVEVSSIDVASRGSDVAVVDGFAYFAYPDGGLVVVNVSMPSSPEIVRTVSYTYGAWDISIHEDVLYLGCHGLGLRILDISAPEDPTHLSSYNDVGEVCGVSGNGECLAIADLQEGAKLLNVTDPEDPILIGEHDEAAPHDVYYDGTYVYLADQDRQFILLDFDGSEVRAFVKVSQGNMWLWMVPISLVTSGSMLLLVTYLKNSKKD